MFPAKPVYLSTVVFLVLILTACGPVERDHQQKPKQTIDPMEINYARGFRVQKSANITVVTVEVPNGSGTQAITYALVPKEMSAPAGLSVDHIIKVPAKTLVVTSTSHIPFLDLLEVSDYLVGFPNTDYISSKTMRSRIDQNLIKNIGSPNGLDFESLIELQPELVVTYVSGLDRGGLDQLETGGIPVVLNLDFLEETPLGRAEWIKFMGLMVGESYLADSVFREIEKDYHKQVALTAEVGGKPLVFSGILYGDTWFAPGGKSFAARFIEDAGGQYTWSDKITSGSFELSFEAVLERNLNTEFWIGVGMFSNRADLEAADARYGNFKAFKTGNVFNYHGRLGSTGGFEYLELGGARPDLVLADFIKILHPDLLPDYQPYFFRRLK